MSAIARILCAAAVMALFVVPAAAQKQPPSQESRDAEINAAFEAAVKAATTGPAPVPLIDQATLKLPAGYRYIPKAEGARLMRAMGNSTGAQFVGMVIPAADVAWFVTLDFVKAGYVKDDDAKDWKPDELLKTLRDGTEAGNADRAERGFPPIEVAGWVEPPVYSAETHRLVWAANVRRKGQTTGGSVNYNTYALGREGYFELNMIGSHEVVTRDKGRAQELLAALAYDPGKSYADFNPKTDRVAEYGLAALVAGVAAKKLGMFALIAAFFAKFAKVILIGGAAVLAGVAKLFGGRKKTEG